MEITLALMRASVYPTSLRACLKIPVCPLVLLLVLVLVLETP